MGNSVKTIFQLVGNLNHRHASDMSNTAENRGVFDFRTEQAFQNDLQQWKPYRHWLKYPQQKVRIKAIIREWENLKWHEFEFGQRHKFKSLQYRIYQH